jgi:hypothetical protein
MTNIVKTKRPPKCSICRQIPKPNCDWKQGRCPHNPSLIDQLVPKAYKIRLSNLFKFFKGK